MMTASPISLPVANGTDVVAADLDYCCSRLADVFERMSGRRVLLTGGAGFLGHYLVQSVIAWNQRADPGDRIRLTVADSYVRGMPIWLRDLRSNSLRTVQHDVTKPL